jgi:hypothetical protein
MRPMPIAVKPTEHGWSNIFRYRIDPLPTQREGMK